MMKLGGNLYAFRKTVSRNSFPMAWAADLMGGGSLPFCSYRNTDGYLLMEYLRDL